MSQFFFLHSSFIFILEWCGVYLEKVSFLEKKLKCDLLENHMKLEDKKCHIRPSTIFKV